MTALELLPLTALVAMLVIASDRRPAVTAALALRGDVHDPAAGLGCGLSPSGPLPISACEHGCLGTGDHLV